MKISFSVMDITVVTDVISVSHKCKDGNNTLRTVMITETTAVVDFWGFRVESGNFTELASIKSSLQYYMNCYWRRSGKEGSTIEFKKEIVRVEPLYKTKRLVFEAKYKAGKQSLYICYLLGDDIVDGAYLDCHDVMQLDIALGKVINIIRPNILN